jgi:hypothetical protein
MCCFGCLVVVLVTLFGSRDRGVWGAGFGAAL